MDQLESNPLYYEDMGGLKSAFFAWGHLLGSSNLCLKHLHFGFCSLGTVLLSLMLRSASLFPYLLVTDVVS